MLHYTLVRECWNEKTYNGFTDNPYWKIEFDGYQIGLKDDGHYWSLINDVDVNQSHIKEKLISICVECKIGIKGMKHS